MAPEDEVEVLEKVVGNRLVLLYTLARLQEHGAVDKWKIQKICFFTQLASQEEGVRTTNYEFFKWDHGPMSSGIYHDCNVFEHLGLLRRNRYWISITEEGEQFLDGLKDLFEDEENQVVIDHIDTWAEQLGPHAGRYLRELSHRFEMDFHGENTRIEDVPNGYILLYPMDDRDALYTFTIDRNWLETLETMFSADYREIKEILSTPTERSDFLSWSEVFESS